MNSFFYAIADFFELTFKLMPSIGPATNLIFMAVITYFTVYWIVQMKKNPDKARH